MIFLMAACDTIDIYNYIMPESEDGSTCVAVCEDKIQACRDDAEESYLSCLKSVRDAYADYQNCEDNCSEPETCKPPEFKACTQEYNSCFEECGGVVEVE